MGEDYSGGVLNAATELIRAKWSVPREKFGVPDGKLAVQNGLLDIRTRTLEPIEPEDYLTSQLPIEYDPDAECPEFQASLDTVVPEDEKQQKLQEFVGYCFWPSASYKRALMLLGETDTGKSTFLRVVEQLFREEDIANVSPEKLQSSKHEAANLEHKMVNIVDELDSHHLDMTDEIKKAISGDPMTAEPKYEQAYRFTPTCKHIFASNKSLEVSRSEEAFWNRWITVVFEEQIPEDEQVSKDEMLARFEDEAAGILNWALDGLDRLRAQGGFSNVRSVDETYQIWTEFGDEINEFIDLMIRPAKGNIVFTDDLYAAYEKFCELTDTECTLNQDQLTHEMQERGIGEYTMKWNPDSQQTTSAFEDITIQDLGPGVDREQNI
ncbi:MAG: phage/plasmid primase, P4 family [Halopenitus sp.]